MDYKKQPGQTLLIRNLNKNTELPLISIVTPYYNGRKYFEQTYRCVQNQTFPWYEWVIVNDGSTDAEDVAWMKQLVSSDARIKVYDQPNGGQASARNCAVQHAAADIVIPLDCDDLITPQFVECIYWGLWYNPDAVWCYTDSVGFGEQEYEWIQPFSASRMKTENLLVCTAGIRKSALISVGGYRVQRDAYDEDWALWLTLLQKGYFPVHLALRGFWYR